ncbi:hypothetical protein DY000_02057247 [Brassica cretica]|uniref:Uncharacterized protein n=1 Tax=Brassica cretica TaxID=69181 RepID=A0ABQ7AEF1_BRACR|nr:hypothetical protein DY000_02057247 [Brassica cretica]
MPNGSSKGYCLLGFPFGVLLFLVLSSFPMNESPHQQFFSSLTLSSSLLDHTNALQSSSSTSSLSNSPTISIKKRSNLERIEEELRKARVAIRRAVKLKNYTSNEDMTYIPTGQIYRNSFAFHQLS